MLERRAIARVEPAEALSGPEPEADHSPESAPAVAEAPVAGSVVPHWRVGLTMEVRAPDYQRLVGVLEAEAEAEAGGSGLRARELAARPPAGVGAGEGRGGGVEGEAAAGAGPAGRGASRGVHAEAGCRVTFRLRWRARRRPMSMVSDHRTAASLLSGRVS
ncbi:hypothetical protein [Streptomyces sp. NBC_01390]|uniref:hypothetical protein n=1 Tax=Streptomyces sp. NBC_01390 TaxID=2903850 RepID=UPI00386A849C